VWFFVITAAYSIAYSNLVRQFKIIFNKSCCRSCEGNDACVQVARGRANIYVQVAERQGLYLCSGCWEARLIFVFRLLRGKANICVQVAERQGWYLCSGCWEARPIFVFRLLRGKACICVQVAERQGLYLCNTFPLVLFFYISMNEFLPAHLWIFSAAVLRKNITILFPI